MLFSQFFVFIQWLILQCFIQTMVNAKHFWLNTIKTCLYSKNNTNVHSIHNNSERFCIFLHSIPSDSLCIDNFMILFPCGSNILKMSWANECAKARLTHLHRLEALSGALCFTYFFEKCPINSLQ